MEIEEGSVVKGTCNSYRVPGLVSSTHLAVHNHPLFHYLRTQGYLLVSVGARHKLTHKNQTIGQKTYT